MHTSASLRIRHPQGASIFSFSFRTTEEDEGGREREGEREGGRERARELNAATFSV